MTAESYQSTTMRLTQQELGACTLIEDLLPLYIEGEVSPSSRDLIVEHLARCERCAGFLAGAQSVRAQLRRDGAQHVAVITNKLPEQHVVGVVQLLATLSGVLFCCGLGGTGSALAWHGLSYGSSAEFPTGVIFIGVALAALLSIARMRGPFASARLLTLLASCALGGMAVLPILFAGHGPGVLLGMLMGLLGVAGVWIAVWSRKVPAGSVRVGS